MRLAVSLYLVIATACGPAVCCCAPSRMAAAVDRVFAGDPALRPGGAGPACCGTSHAPTRPARVPPGPAKRCPCQEHGGPHQEAVVQSPEARSELSASGPPGDAGAVFSAFDTALGVGVSASPVTHTRHSLGASACPRAPHVLRC